MADARPFALRGLKGRNGFDAPIDVPDDQAIEMMNIGSLDASLGQKRHGSSTVTISSIHANSVASAGFRHVPGADEAAAELWIMEFGGGSDGLHRILSGNVQSEPTMKDAVASEGWNMSAASLNGHLHFAYDSTKNRMHAWDGSTVRRSGLAMPTAAVFATAAQSAGAVTDTRKYKFTLLQKSGSTIVRQSELSTASSAQVLTSERFTGNVTVGGSGVPDEGETHWEMWAASILNDYGTYHYIGEAQIGTSIEDNNVTLTGDAPPLVGTNSLLPSCKYVVATDARLVMTGAWETAVDGTNFGEITPKNNRVWWTPALGDRDIGDDERIVDTVRVRSYLDVDEATTGVGQIDGVVYVFSFRSCWRLTPTNNDTSPYVRTTISREVGCSRHQSITAGDDENGNPCLYFMSHRGPYRVGAFGLEYCGRDVEDLTLGSGASTDRAHSVYHHERHQVWMFFESGESGAGLANDCLIKFDVTKGRRVQGQGVRGGWVRQSGISTWAHFSVMASNEFSPSMSVALTPYVGILMTPPTVWKLDDATATTDPLVLGSERPFQAYIQTKPYQFAGEGRYFTTTHPILLAAASLGVDIQVTCVKDFGLESRTSTVTLSPEASETRVSRVALDGAMDHAEYLSFTLGDAEAVSNAWTLDKLAFFVEPQETR